MKSNVDASDTGRSQLTSESVLNALLHEHGDRLPETLPLSLPPEHNIGRTLPLSLVLSLLSSILTGWFKLSLKLL